MENNPWRLTPPPPLKAPAPPFPHQEPEVHSPAREPIHAQKTRVSREARPMPDALQSQRAPGRTRWLGGACRESPPLALSPANWSAWRGAARFGGAPRGEAGRRGCGRGDAWARGLAPPEGKPRSPWNSARPARRSTRDGPGLVAARRGGDAGGGPGRSCGSRGRLLPQCGRRSRSSRQRAEGPARGALAGRVAAAGCGAG